MGDREIGTDRVEHIEHYEHILSVLFHENLII